MPRLADPTTAGTTQVTVSVGGMDCGSCAETIAVALRRESGVNAASVSFGSGRASVTFDPAETDLATLERRIRGLGYQVDGNVEGSLRFTIDGMDCGSCAASVERAVANLPGIANASVNFPSATLTVTLDAASQAGARESVAAAVSRAGFVATPREVGKVPTRSGTPVWRDRRLRPAATGALLWLTGLLLQLGGAPSTLAVLAFAGGIVIAGRGPARAAWQAVRVRHLDMNVLMVSATIGAALIGEWSEGALVVVLFSLGGTLQAMTIDRTRSSIRALMTLTPDRATRLDGEQEIVVPVDTLRSGDLLRIKPGERIATDGLVLDGQSTLDQRAITGESLPVDAVPDTEVFAGSVNGAGSLIVRVTSPASTSTLARVIHLVEEAQASRAPAQETIDRFAAIYTPLVLVAAILVATGGVLLSGDPDTWFYRALVLLVIACPCALVISTPVAIVSAIGAASRRGVLIKGGAALEMAARVRSVAFDKTGTLTIGRPIVGEIIAVPPYSERAVLTLAASTEALSEHPLGQAIVARALHDAVDLLPAREFVAQAGRGATARVDDQWITVGSARLAQELAAVRPGDDLTTHIDRLAANGVTALVVMSSPVEPDRAAVAIGLIGLADTPRPGAREAVQRLRAMGAEQIMMLTGDATPVAAAVGRTVGVTEIHAELLPHEKASAVRELQRQHGAVAMIGDGINDAPALATADLGIAMGAAGTDVALETADVALMGDDLSSLAGTLALARRATRTIRQNIGLSLAIKALALVLGIAGFVDLWVAVLADMGTSLAVTANALRLLRPERETRTNTRS